MFRTQILLALFALAAPLIAAEFSGEAALQFTKRAVDFGPRTAGTEANHKLQAYIKTELRSFGCTPVDDKFHTSTPIGPTEMNNILARIPGTSGKAIVITGHFDTKSMPGGYFVGANDGGSSTGFLLELAHVLCRTRPSDDIYLVWLDGEEAYAEWTDTDSLYGSRHLASKWAAEGFAKKVKAVINVDMIGDRDLGMVYEMQSTEWLRNLVWDTAHQLGYKKEFPTQPPGSVGDDHIPFIQAGMPALDIIDFNYGPDQAYWHTPRDTMDKLSARSFTVVGRTVLAAITKLEKR